MKLRPKLAVTLAAVVIPVLVLFTVFRIYSEGRDYQERVATRISARMEARGGERCLDEPQEFHIDARRGFEIFSYGPDLQSANPDAPPLPDDVVEAIRAGEESASASFWDHPRFAGVTVTPTQWTDSPCAALAVYWPDRPSRGMTRFAREIALQTAVAFIVLLLTALVAAGPIVRRIRRLTEAIEEAGGPGYQVDMEVEADDEIGEFARAFNAAGERVRQTVTQLEARDRALTEYIANTTHDLAIPLTVLQHRLRRLQRQLEGDEELHGLADAAMEEAHYIASLITNMGAAARLDRTGEELTLHQCRLGELVERVVSRHEPLAEQKQLDLNWAAPPEPLTVECDSTLVEQALSNFVQNAIQYNSAGGHVSVVLDTANEGFELRVIDDGPGVPEGELEHLTARSFRVEESRTRRPDGQGFGLSIASRVCELHGWNLQLQNRAEGGLEVTVKGALTAESAEI